MKSPKPKYLWKGVFLYNCEQVIKHTYAPTEKSAKMRMINQIAKIDGVKPWDVLEIFDGSKKNYLIEIDRDWRAKYEKSHGRIGI